MSFYLCFIFDPITWMYLGTLYKRVNVTRLTAELPLTSFDTFDMLEAYQFNTYTQSKNMSSSLF